MKLRFALHFCVAYSMAFAPVIRAHEPGDPHTCMLTRFQQPYQPIEKFDFYKYMWEPTWKLAGYKSESAVDQYLGCWKESDANFLAYKNKYKELIQSASEVTDIPFSILACLYFYESKFDKNALSPVGAMGLAQIMPGTWKAMVANLDLKNAVVTNPYVVEKLELGLKKARLTMKDRSQIQVIVKKVKKLYAEKYRKDQLAGKTNLESLRNALDSLEKYPEYAELASVEEYRSNVESALDKHEISEMFDEYKKKLGKSKLTMDPYSPEAAIIMGAVTLKVKMFQGIFGQEYRYDSHDRWVIAAGAYNIGPGAIKCTEDMTASECITIIRRQELFRVPSGKRTETSDHMRGIKNCSEHQNFKDKQDQPHPKGCKG